MTAVDVPVDVVRSMLDRASLRYLLTGGEASGLLVGNVESDIVTVTSAPETDYESEPSFCRIPPLAAAELTSSLPDDLTVVGWWHSHPGLTLDPSATDLETIASMARSSPVVVSIIVDPLAGAMDVYITDGDGTRHEDGGES